MPEHSFASLQARLTQSVDSTDEGRALEETARALSLEDPAERLVALVRAIETERLLVPAVVESDNCDDNGVTAVDTPQGPAVAAFTSVEAMKSWSETARPMPMSGKRVAMLAVAHSGGRLMIDEGSASVRVPRPATVALAHGDAWLPAWQDGELKEELAAFQDSSVAYVKPLPSEGAVLKLEVGIVAGAKREDVTVSLGKIAQAPRLRPAAEIVEIVPRMVALS
ncbi:MAG: SseB family protein [Actinomycetaceae bacterium]|nr:SseB family protein [Actinomycetaceae bacterium]